MALDAYPQSVRRCDTLAAMPTDTRSIDLRVRLRPSEADKLRELAAKDDEPVSAVVRRAIRRYIEQVEGKVIEPGEGRIQVAKGRVPGIRGTREGW